MLFAVLLGATAKADSIRIGKHQETKAEKGSEEYFSKAFSGIFDAEVTYPQYNDPSPKWRFYDDGTAIMFHNFFHPLYECYQYTIGKGVIKMKGICSIRTGVNMNMLPEKPADFELEVITYGKDAALAGRETVKNGRTYKMSLSSSDYIPRFENIDFASIIKCRASGITQSHENLWLVTDEYGAVARTLPDEGEGIVKFVRSDIFQGKMDEDGGFVLVDYIDGAQLYVNANEVRKVSNEKMLQEILYNDAEAGLYFTEWKNTFPEKKRAADTSGFLNGWMAGRRSAEIFIPLIFLALLLVILNKLYPPFFPNFLFRSTYIALILITLFELWYAVSLKQDALWFIFDPKDFVHGFAAVTGTLVFIFLQIEMILSLEMSFGEIYSAYSRCPFWIELVLALAALFAGLPLLISGQTLLVLCAYLLLLAACLPTSIGYMIHSSNKGIILPFLLLCYPFKYIFMLPLLLLYVFGKASKTKVYIDTDNDNSHQSVRDMEGNLVNLTKTSNGDFIDNEGNIFMKNGDSFIPTGADRKDGPYR